MMEDHEQIELKKVYKESRDWGLGFTQKFVTIDVRRQWNITNTRS